ncbi:MFS general substrate transporter [Meredithblackwellia eburnea MCA 4105]
MSAELERGQPYANAGEYSNASDEKSPAPSSHLVPLEKDWTDAEERRVRRKLDCLIMPLVIAGFFVLQLERGNAANAATDTLFKDVHITQDQFNTGQALLYLGIVMLEIPSQLILHRIGPQWWISFQVLSFGTVATLQNFQHNYAGFLTTRILLGCTETGFIPAALTMISTWYKRDETPFRNSLLFLGREVANAMAGIFAYGILRLAGRHGLAGWRWLFIIEGLLAILVAVVIFLFLPNSPLKPNSLVLRRFNYFNERERYILVARVEHDDAEKRRAREPITRSDIVSVFSNPRIYPHLVITIALNASTTPLTTYGALLIKGLGFAKLKANAMSSVGPWISVFLTPFAGWLSSRTGIRGPLVIFIIAVYWTFWIAFQQESTSTRKWLKYGLLFSTQSLGSAWHPLNGSWLALNMVTPQQRNIVFASFIMCANLGGLVGSQIMRASDAPVYHRGFLVAVSLASLGLAGAIVQHIWYRFAQRKLDRDGVENRDAKTPAKFTL